MFVGVVITAVEPAGFKGDGDAQPAFGGGVGESGEGTGPGGPSVKAQRVPVWSLRKAK